MIYMFLSNNPSSGDINSSNLPCFVYFYLKMPNSLHINFRLFCLYKFLNKLFNYAHFNVYVEKNQKCNFILIKKVSEYDQEIDTSLERINV